MAKLATDGMIDGGLTKYGTGVKLTVCAGQPISFADIATKALAGEVLTAGDFTIANGDTNGRKSTVAAQASLLIDVSGTADHIAIDDGVSEYVITTCTSQALTANGTNVVSVPAFDREIADPV